MSDPLPPAPAPTQETAPAAASSEPAGAAPAAAAKPARVNPYARAAKPAVAPPAPAAKVAAPEATPAPAPTAKPKSSRVLALREAEIQRLKPLVAEREEAMALLAPVVKAKLETLGERARKALEGEYKDRPLALLREIQRLEAMGLLAPPAPAPATTAPPPGPAAGGGAATDPDLEALTRWNELQKKSPTAAQNFYSSNRAAIARAQAKTASRN